MKKFEALSMEELEKVNGGTARSPQSSKGLARLIEVIVDWFS